MYCIYSKIIIQLVINKIRKSSKRKYNICILANNVAGFGSMNVVSNLLQEFAINHSISDLSVFIKLPKIPFWENYIKKLNKNWTIRLEFRSKYKIFRFLSRSIDLIFGHLFLPEFDILIVLGDFPLRVNSKQILLLHNPHIVDKSNKLDFYFHKFFFNLNHRYVNKCFVQTDILKYKLINAFPFFYDKTFSLKMPVKNIFNNKNIIINKSNKIILFYPASFYTHKNHIIIFKFLDKYNQKFINITFNLTINKKNLYLNKYEKNIKFLGEINEEQVITNFIMSDALFFPSVNETYGLPLVEAMKMGKIILCSDLPYAKEICGDQAIYFNPLDVESINNAIEILQIKKSINWLPDWSFALSKIPQDWKIYSESFLEIAFN